MKAISLDAAGTLFDLAEPVGAVYARFGLQAGFTLDPQDVEDRFRSAFGKLPAPDYTLHSDGHTCERAWWRELVLQATRIPAGEAFERFFNQLFNHYEQAQAWRLYDDTLPFLKETSAQYPLAVVSNFDDRLHPVLAGLGLSPFFQVVVSSSQAKSSKPAPKIFQTALHQLALPPSEVLHIGDSLTADYNGARESGMQAFHLQRGKGETLYSALTRSLSSDR